MQTYDTTRGPLWHADLYRLSSDFEVEELGLNDAMVDAICLIEWPDRLGDYLPSNALHLTMTQSVNEEARHLSASWDDPKWDEKMKELAQ